MERGEPYKPSGPFTLTCGSTAALFAVWTHLAWAVGVGVSPWPLRDSLLSLGVVLHAPGMGGPPPSAAGEPDAGELCTLVSNLPGFAQWLDLEANLSHSPACFPLCHTAPTTIWIY